MLFFVISGRLRGSILVTRGSIKNKIRVFLLVTFSGVGSGRVLRCFLTAFPMLVGTLLVVSW